MKMVFISLDNLKQYHNLLMKQLSNGHMSPINICTQCGGLIDGDKCPYCGTKFKWVIDKEDENDNP